MFNSIHRAMGAGQGLVPVGLAPSPQGERVMPMPTPTHLPVRSTPETYRSVACHIGTHSDCSESELSAFPTDLGVTQQTCGCTCHTQQHAALPSTAREEQ